MTTQNRPKRCIATKLGLISMLVALLCFGGILLGQWATTGSFARAGGFEFGWLLAWPMFVTLVGGLAMLIGGGLVDSTRYDHWKKSETGDTA